MRHKPRPETACGRAALRSRYTGAYSRGHSEAGHNRTTLEFHATTLCCTSLKVAFGSTVKPVDVQVEQFFPSGSIVKNGLANMMRFTASGPDRQGILQTMVFQLMDHCGIKRRSLIRHTLLE